MVESILIFKMLIIPFAAYAIGRTVTTESVFAGWRERFKKYAYEQVTTSAAPGDAPGLYWLEDDQDYMEVMQRHEDGSVTHFSSTDYRTSDWPKWRYLTFGKLADLASCITCATGQTAFQLGLWSVLFPIIPASVIMVFAGIGFAYILVDRA